MIDELFTPVQSGYYAVTRWDTTVQPGVMKMFAGTVQYAKAETRVPRNCVIPTLILATDIKFGIRSADDDPNMVWMCIQSAQVDIALGTNRTGGTILAVSQQVYDWLKPYQPTHVKCAWVIEESVGDHFVLVAYRGFSSPDGGYPVHENADGSVTMYDVHDLDIQYYRSVRFDASSHLISNQKVSLNW